MQDARCDPDFTDNGDKMVWDSHLAGPIANETDLRQLTFAMLPESLQSGTIVLERSNTHARVWSSRIKGEGNEILVVDQTQMKRVWRLWERTERDHFHRVKSDLWIEGYGLGETVITASYLDANGALIWSDSVKVRMDKAKVFIMFGWVGETKAEQEEWEAEAKASLKPLTDDLGDSPGGEKMMYEITVLPQVQMIQVWQALTDFRTVAVIWVSHGWARCTTDCDDMASHVYDWGNPGKGVPISVTRWAQWLQKKRLRALWAITCFSKDRGKGYHLYSRGCLNCGAEICPDHGPGAWLITMTNCPVCSRGYTMPPAPTIRYHDQNHPPSSLKTFESLKNELVEPGGYMMTYSTADYVDAPSDADVHEAIREALR